jgi:hypothetical protein
MLRFLRRAPTLEARFVPEVAVARELVREVEVRGELTLCNTGRDATVTDLELVLVAGGTRRVDLEVPRAWRGALRLAAGAEVREAVAWTLRLAAPMRAPAAEIQVISAAGGRRTPLARTAAFPLANE